MTLKTAINTLSNISFPGVRKSYDLEDLQAVHHSDLPALLPLPTTGENERDSFGYTGASFMETHVITHRLLVAPVEIAIMGEVLPRLVSLIDDYQTTIQELTTHAGAADLNITDYKAGVDKWYGTEYHLVDFSIEVKIIE